MDSINKRDISSVLCGVRRTTRAFATLEYVMLIIIIMAGLITFQVYIKRGMQGQYRKTGEGFGLLRQYNTGATKDCAYDPNIRIWYSQACLNNKKFSPNVLAEWGVPEYCTPFFIDCGFFTADGCRTSQAFTMAGQDCIYWNMFRNWCHESDPVAQSICASACSPYYNIITSAIAPVPPNQCTAREKEKRSCTTGCP